MKRRTLFLLVGFSVLIMIGAVVSQLALADGYYFRWTTPLPTVGCDSGGGNVYFSASDQYFEYNLPAGASLHKYSIRNGITITDVIDPAPTGTGTGSNPTFDDSLAAAYYTIQLQVDTVINGAVVYRSTLTMSCPDETASISNQDFGSGYCPPYPGWLGRRRDAHANAGVLRAGEDFAGRDSSTPAPTG